SKSACPPPHGSPRGPRRAQAPLSGLLPDTDFEMRLPERLGQLRDLRLELLLPRRRTGPARRQARLPRLEEVGLPPADRLLGHPLPPPRPSGRGPGREGGQPGSRPPPHPEHRLASPHRTSPSDSTNRPANKFDARHN